MISQPNLLARLCRPSPSSSSVLHTNKARFSPFKISAISLKSKPLIRSSKLSHQTYRSPFNDIRLVESGYILANAADEEILVAEDSSPGTIAAGAAEEMVSFLIDNFPSPAVCPNLLRGDARVRAEVKRLLYLYSSVLLAYGALLFAHVVAVEDQLIQ